MRYEVIPRVSLPVHLRTYTYVSNSRIESGTVVRIPWKKKTIDGIVVGEEAVESVYDAKEIIEISDTRIPRTFVAFLLSWKSVSPASLCMRYIPPIPKRVVREPKSVEVDSDAEKFFEIPDVSESVCAFICDTHAAIEYVLEHVDFKNRTVYVLTAETGIAEYKRLFFGIVNGTVSHAVIVSGKRGWWLPVDAYIVYESGSPWHEESMLRPYYDIETMLDHVRKTDRAIVHMCLPRKKDISVGIVHMSKIGIDMDHMRTVIRAAVRRGDSILVYYNRLGTYRHILCERCAYALTCPQEDCDMALYTHEREYICPIHGSADMRAVSGICPVCGGTVWKRVGYGIDRLRTDMETEFPDAKDLIIYTTRKPLYGMPWKHIGVCICPNIDLDIIVPNAKRESDIAWYIGHMRALARARTDIVIYTSMPDRIAALLRRESSRD